MVYVRASERRRPSMKAETGYSTTASGHAAAFGAGTPMPERQHRGLTRPDASTRGSVGRAQLTIFEFLEGRCDPDSRRFAHRDEARNGGRMHPIAPFAPYSKASSQAVCCTYETEISQNNQDSRGRIRLTTRSNTSAVAPVDVVEMQQARTRLRRELGTLRSIGYLTGSRIPGFAR